MHLFCEQRSSLTYPPILFYWNLQGENNQLSSLSNGMSIYKEALLMWSLASLANTIYQDRESEKPCEGPETLKQT